MIQMLVDCDPGVDDSLSLLFALNRPDVCLRAITTCTGNVSAAQGAKNALSLLRLAGADGQVPVCAGSEEPLGASGEHRGFPSFIHGEDGLGDVGLAASSCEPVQEDVREFMWRTAVESEGELVLVTLGRLTNVARTIELHPDFPRLVRRVVCMGGTVHHAGNVGPHAEANIFGDPVAADLCVRQSWDMTMVGLDVTTQVRLYEEDFRRTLALSRPDSHDQVEFLCKEFGHYLRGCRLQNELQGYCPMHDPLAMLVAVDPSLVELRRMVTRVETEGELTRGQVVVDLREQPIEGGYVSHALRVDADRAKNRLFSAFQESFTRDRLVAREARARE